MLSAIFDNKPLLVEYPLLRGGFFDANLTILKGQPLAEVAGASTNAILTFTVTGTPTAGSVRWRLLGQVVEIPFNATAASVTALLNATYDQGNFTVAGGAFPGTPITVTLRGKYAGLTAQAPTLVSSTLNAGSMAATVSTQAVPAGKIVAWNGAKVANPTGVPSVSATGTGGTLATGAHTVHFSWYTENGETVASPAALVTLTSAQNIRVAAISSGSVPAGAQGLNVYVSGQLARVIPLVSAAVPQTDIASMDATIVAKGLPDANSAVISTAGAGKIVGFSAYDLVTDETGAVFIGSKAQSTAMAGKLLEAIVAGGTFDQASLIVSDWAEVLRQLGGRIISGAIATGNARIHFAPAGGNK